MRSELYLYDRLRKKYKRDLTNIIDLYFERIEPTFKDPEKEAEEYTNNLNEEVGTSINWGADDAPDPCDAQEAVWQAGVERYELLSSMQYRTLGLWISCMCQVWEQQLYSFILHEAKLEGIIYDEGDMKSGFKFVSETLTWHGVNYKEVQNGKIEELRELVNVLKHGKGRSEENLRILRPDFFNCNGTDVLKKRNATLLEPTLQIKDTDFKNYHNALMEFWDEFPEYAYSIEDLPVIESEDTE
ncbi:hypothetical protein [Caproiciproducens faecalis]|uniref:Uncharacterized protein n=1 Tax=Caproiciproducens faecalis TaxID=2820301 RepID=A0ABS7DMZ7_9FIRM|nr:hypothetical protein [Caproiciproducens faecalis]MBW7572489.1 hypothetical protein [Caproiciproducens faecalis]